MHRGEQEFQLRSQAATIGIKLAEVLEYPGGAQAAQVIDAPPLEAPRGPSSSRTQFSTTFEVKWNTVYGVI